MMKLHIQLADVVTDIAFARMRNGKISLGYTHPGSNEFQVNTMLEDDETREGVHIYR